MAASSTPSIGLGGWLRLVLLGLHLAQGTATVALAYPWLPLSWRLALKKRWSRRLLAILGIRLETPAATLPAASLVVANHVSWLDIYLINAVQPCAFIAKAEVRQWPLIGWLCAHTDTVFLQRGSRSHAKVVNGQIAALFQDGQRVALFPEGTTTDGRQLLPFHAALLQPAIDAGRPITPLALTYRTATGLPQTAPAYAGETTLWQSLLAILAARGDIRVSLHPAPALATDQGQHRRELAATARAAIAAGLDLPGETAANDPAVATELPAQPALA